MGGFRTEEFSCEIFYCGKDSASHSPFHKTFILPHNKSFYLTKYPYITIKLSVIFGTVTFLKGPKNLCMARMSH